MKGTPKKRRKKTIQPKKIRRLQSALGVAKEGETARQEKALDDALQKLTENLAALVRMQIKLHKTQAKGRRYSPQLKSMAISLLHASGKAYRMLSKIFILP